MEPDVQKLQANAEFDLVQQTLVLLGLLDMSKKLVFKPRLDPDTAHSQNVVERAEARTQSNVWLSL